MEATPLPSPPAQSPGYRIKQTPDDFIVEEITDLPAFSPDGPYLIAQLSKEGMNTQDACRKVAEGLHLDWRDIRYGGLKDKQAMTTQAISIKGIGDEAIRAFSHPRISLKVLGRSDTPMHLGSHTKNKFLVRVHIDSLGARLAYDAGSKRIAQAPRLLNYFDEQRFSTNNVAAGLALVCKDFAKAAEIISAMDLPGASAMRDWLALHPHDPVGALSRLTPDLLLLFLHALQSRIWNDTLSMYLRQTATGSSTIHEVAYSQGTLAFPDDTGLLDGVMVPIVGFGRAPEARFEPIIKEELAKFGIAERDFIIRQLPKASCEGALRAGTVPIEEFCAISENETTVVLSFVLPKGSYATMLVKQLFLA